MVDKYAPYGWERDMLRLILATLFRAGEIDVSPTKATDTTTIKTQPLARR
ncbi:MAG: hypothetical protein IT427_08610 [Pirellulales bacterium]|nr:hypothetical protein [Pirellulales bacterium]